MQLFEPQNGSQRGEPRAYIQGLKAGDSVDEIFLVVSKTMRSTRSGTPFLALELRDRTGLIQARVWQQARTCAGRAQVGVPVRVEGQVEEFNDSRQINVTSLETVKGKVDLAELYPPSPRARTEMEEELRRILDLVECPKLRALLAAFFEKPEVSDAAKKVSERAEETPDHVTDGQDFRYVPAAKSLHHATIGGLLEHTLSVVSHCRAIADHYLELNQELPDGKKYRINRDLLLTGALLHDVGKVKELSLRTFDYTDEGELIGHIVLGADMVTREAEEVGLPAETICLLQHMLLSHHGQYEWGSPKRPKTIEAMILHYADDLDSKVNMINDSVNDADPESVWTERHWALSRRFYRGGL